MSIPAFFFSELVTCKCCGQVKMFDDGGVPCDPDHPYYNRWICDDCHDQIAAQSEEVKENDRK